jgi:hypothetical protein
VFPSASPRASRGSNLTIGRHRESNSANKSVEAAKHSVFVREPRNIGERRQNEKLGRRNLGVGDEAFEDRQHVIADALGAIAGSSTVGTCCRLAVGAASMGHSSGDCRKNGKVQRPGVRQCQPHDVIY